MHVNGKFYPFVNVNEYYLLSNTFKQILEGADMGKNEELYFPSLRPNLLLRELTCRIFGQQFTTNLTKV